LGSMLALKESLLPGPVPRYEIPRWREQFGVVAGVTARGADPALGSKGFDLGLWSDAPVGEVMGHWRQFRLAEPGFDAWILGHQVHGVSVRWHERGAGWQLHERVDGHATSSPGALLLITIADCIPVYLLAPRQPAVALLHAGWRGTAGGILQAGLQLLLSKSGASPSEIVMHCGVGICGSCYEVGLEVLAGLGVKAEGLGPWHLDLRERLAQQARALGVVNISTSQWCSAHDRTAFYSHRASGGRDGRMVAYLGIPTAGQGSETAVPH